MAWILLEGLDRSGKSTVAEFYKKQGYEVVHMSAPDGKYSQPGYSGPSYFEEVVDIYNIYNGKDVVFDRTVYGEYIWPEIYNRQPLLAEEDVEYLSRLEYNNNTTKILMHDENVEAHWQRCVDNKEPLNRVQFVQASRLYDKLAIKHNFQKMQLSDFDFSEEGAELRDNTASERELYEEAVRPETNNDYTIENGSAGHGEDTHTTTLKRDGISLEQKLQRANAIKSILKTKIIKKQQPEFQRLEEDIKTFLTNELENIFTPKQEGHFTNNEVQILKIFAKRIEDKQNLKE